MEDFGYLLGMMASFIFPGRFGQLDIGNTECEGVTTCMGVLIKRWFVTKQWQHNAYIFAYMAREC